MISSGCGHTVTCLVDGIEVQPRPRIPRCAGLEEKDGVRVLQDRARIGMSADFTAGLTSRDLRAAVLGGKGGSC